MFLLISNYLLFLRQCSSLSCGQVDASNNFAQYVVWYRNGKNPRFEKYLKLIGKDNKDLKRLNRKVLVVHLIKYAKHSAASLTDSIEKELRIDNIKYTKNTGGFKNRLNNMQNKSLLCW